MTDTTVDNCRIIPLETHANPRGNITVTQNGGQLPFDIKRIYYIFDIPTGSERGGHSHFREQRLLVAVSGCFDVEVHDGRQSRVFTLRRPDQGLYIPAGLWRVLDNFSAGCVVLALSSTNYDEADYVRDFDTFVKLKLNK